MTRPRGRQGRPRAPTGLGWIGLRIQGPVDVMERLQHALGRDLHLNDSRGAKPCDEARDGRLYYWIKPSEAQLGELARLLVEARPDYPDPSTDHSRPRSRASARAVRRTAPGD